ncbi:efflux RND transporter permease subunit [Halobacteriovorax vibrionivorans]|uniref:Efflux RND transporter permease subunit n=1 Tax=Halobacteriovorax vibrionivorans TaxID=2152716 RepID=A0ABY0IGT3_9BACT|nr:MULTISPECIES: efflux RND transporter permease subunit [Halobacteriovorax]RZF21795.1 efflux RND transporter permease subunit [Halobacteriovorax vibrionivorans]TGD48370.1 efflux RND transporter permease subunit [Halobacteriovorax sp. Y22]
MKKLVSYFVDNSFLVNLLSVMMILFGIISLSHMKRDLISNWASKRIQITATLVGAGPSQVEKFLTYPIERAIKGSAGIDKIWSNSQQGYMRINVNVKDDYEDISELESRIKDAIENIRGDLPSETEDIVVRHLKQTESWFNYYAIENFDEQNDTHQKWMLKIKEQLERVNGVSRVDNYNAEKNLYIQLNEEKLARYRLSPADIYRKINDTFRIYPLGSITKGSDTYSVEIENNEYDLEALNNIIIRSNNSSHTLRLKDIASLEYRLPKKTREYYTNGKRSSSFNIFKDTEADSITLKNVLEKEVAQINENAPEGLHVISVEDGPAFIERQINALQSNAFLGIILVVITLFLFLGLKTSLMTSLGMPLAYFFTFTVLDTFGISIDLISVVGLLLVIGIIVDDAIIIAEQYMQNLEKGASSRDAAIGAVLSTWKPICGTVATTLIAFTPILVGKDSMSNILLAIPVVVFAALLLSLFESFFILPNHLHHFVSKANIHHESSVFQRFKRGYVKLLEFSLKWRYIVLASFVVIMIASMIFASKNINFNFNLSISSESVEFIGELKETKGLKDTYKQLAPVEKIMEGIDKDKYKNYQITVGQNYTNGKKQVGPQYFSYRLSFSQLDDNVEANKKDVEAYLKDKLDKLQKTGVFSRLEVKIAKGGNDESRENLVEVTIRSQTPFNVEKVTADTKKTIEDLKIEGIKSVDLDDSLFKDAWIFTPKKNEIQSRGLTLAQVSNQLVQFINKNEVYEYAVGNRKIKFYTYVKDGDELNFEDLGKLPVVLSNGNIIRASQLGSWKKEKRQSVIKHSNLMRRVVVDLPFDKEVIKKEVLINKVKLVTDELSKKYPDLTFNAQDADEQSRKNKASMAKKFAFALLGIFFILAIVLRSIMQPILICTAIPFGVIGVIWAFYLQGLDISLMAIIGIIGMAGVVVNDSLLLVVTINENRKDWFSFHRPEIIDGAASRLRPIILTSITTLGGVFPMAYAIGGDAGFTKSLAMSMGWGLLFATVLTLVVLPCMLLVQRDFMVFFSRKILRRRDSYMDDTIEVEEDIVLVNQNLEEESVIH